MEGLGDRFRRLGSLSTPVEGGGFASEDKMSTFLCCLFVQIRQTPKSSGGTQLSQNGGIAGGVTAFLSNRQRKYDGASKK